MALPPSTTSAAPATGSCGREEIQLRTFWIEVTPEKKTYRPGDRVALHVVVTRPGHEDPAGLGQPLDPPLSLPAQGIPVNAGVEIGYFYPYSDTVATDAEGKATLFVKLPRNVSTGQASIDAMAKAKQVDTYCFDLVEIGFRHVPNAFRVVR